MPSPGLIHRGNSDALSSPQVSREMYNPRPYSQRKGDSGTFPRDPETSKDRQHARLLIRLQSLPLEESQGNSLHLLTKSQDPPGHADHKDRWNHLHSLLLCDWLEPGDASIY